MGAVSWDDFQSYITDPYVASHFHRLNQDVNNAKMSFKMLFKTLVKVFVDTAR